MFETVHLVARTKVVSPFARLFAVDAPELALDGVGVQQRLRRVLPRTVSRADDRDLDGIGRPPRRACERIHV